MSDPHLVRADNGFFYVHWLEGRRTKRISTRTKDHPTASDFLSGWLRHTQHEPRADDDLTIADLWPVYREKHVETRTVIGRQLDSVWRRLSQHFGALAPAAVTQAVVDSYYRKRATGRIGRPSVSGSIRKELNALLACLKWCAHPRRKLIDRASVPDFELPDPSVARDRWLRIPELQRLLEAARHLRSGARLSRGERFLWLALETAARKTAIAELTWDRVDFETGVVHYAIPGSRASKKRRVSAPISTTLRPILERAYAERTGPLVLDTTRDPWDVVKAIAKQAGLDGVSPHTLRHTSATQMARRGVPIAHIADVLGNTIAMTERVYRHHCPEATRKAVEMISGGLLDAAE